MHWSTSWSPTAAASFDPFHLVRIAPTKPSGRFVLARSTFKPLLPPPHRRSHTNSGMNYSSRPKSQPTNQSINHLRRYGPDPTKCAYEGVHGHRYDVVAHPLAVCGMHVLVHDKPAPRPSWSPHGAKGCYLGPALLHHKCWRTWIIDTRSERISDTLAWFPDPFKLPGPDPHAMVAASLDDLTVALSHLPAPNTLAPDQRRTIQDRAATATSDLRAILDVCNHVSTHNASPTAALLCGE